MLGTVALLALMGAASAQQPTPASDLQMSPELEETYASGVRMARFGHGLFTISGIGSLTGTLIYYLSADDDWQRIGLYTMYGGTAAGLVATPLAVVGANRAAAAVSKGGRAVPRASGRWSMGLLGLSALSVGGALALYNDEEPLWGELVLYLGWSLASSSFELAMRQLGEAEWAHDRLMMWGVAPTSRGVQLIVRF